VRIEVRSEVGRPLPDTEAYIFFGPDSVVSRPLESSGDLVVRWDELDGVRRIVIRHLGFRSAFVFPEELAATTRVELLEEAIAIEGVGGPDPRADLRRSAPVGRWIEANGVVVANSHPFVRRFLNWAYPASTDPPPSSSPRPSFSTGPPSGTPDPRMRAGSHSASEVRRFGE
jgi:hypothetical protein